jgi:hypothetical protein
MLERREIKFAHGNGGRKGKMKILIQSMHAERS